MRAEHPTHCPTSPLAEPETMKIVILHKSAPTVRVAPPCPGAGARSGRRGGSARCQRERHLGLSAPPKKVAQQPRPLHTRVRGAVLSHWTGVSLLPACACAECLPSFPAGWSLSQLPAFHLTG